MVIQAMPDAKVLVPDGGWILGAKFSRQGQDLILVGKNGEQLLIRDFFRLENPPDILTEGGSLIRADLAVRLSGPIAPGEFAQTGAGAAAKPIGEVEDAEEAKVTRTDGTVEELEEGDPIYQGDIVETGEDGEVAIIFIDESAFSLGDGGRMVIDEMVFNPSEGEGSSSVSLVQGAFSFVSGQIAKTDPNAMSLKTPVATIGIRGTIAGKAAPEGEENTLTLLPDASGTTGEITMTNAAGTVVMNTVGATVAVSSFNQPPPPPTILSKEEMSERYSSVLSILPESVRPPSIVEGAQTGEEGGQRRRWGRANGV